MDLAWIWSAAGALAAVVTATWGIVQIVSTWSPHSQYRQWAGIRDDHETGSAPWRYAEGRRRYWLVELAARGPIRRRRVRLSIYYATLVAVVMFLWLALPGFRSFSGNPGAGAVFGYVALLGPTIFTWIRSEVDRGAAFRSVFGEDPPPLLQRLAVNRNDLRGQQYAPRSTATPGNTSSLGE